MTTRYPSGLSTAAPQSTFGNLGVPDPFKYQLIADDFAYLDAAAWLPVETQAGATQAAQAGGGGLILLTNTAAIGDVNALSTPIATINPVAGKKFFAKARFRVSDVINVNVTLGVGNAATTLLPADGMYVTKVGTTISVTIANTSVLVSASYTDTSGLLATEFFTLGLEYDGKNVNAYYGSEAATGPLTERKVASVPADTINFAAARIGFVGMKNVNAVANTASLDYVAFAQER